jgi:hypothetical protein
MENGLKLPSQKALLTEALVAYRKLWPVWISSDGCFLSKIEIDCIHSYLETSCYAISGASVGLSYLNFYFTIKRSVTKLNLFLPLFETWSDTYNLLSTSELEKVLNSN